MKLLRSVGLVGALTGLSRVLGMVRDILMAGRFGTSLYMSAFTVAFTVPNLFRRLFGEGALSAAFIPIFVEIRTKLGDAAAWLFARRVISLVAVVLGAIVLIGLLIISGVMPFAQAPQAVVVLELMRIMFGYLFFICLVALSMGILNAFGHFALPAATPCLLNLVWIAALLFICPLGSAMDGQMRILAWAILAAGLIQWLVQFPVLRRYGYRWGWSLSLKDERVTRMLRLMGPAAMGMAVTQLNVMIDRLLAFGAAPWAPAALFFSERLIYLPLGLFATAFSTVLFPRFSADAARADRVGLKATLEQAMRYLLFIIVPAAVGLWVLAAPIVQMLFGWGAFTELSVSRAAIALRCYAPGLVVFSMVKLLVPFCYAHQDMRGPMRLGLWCVLLNIALSVLCVLTWPLAYKHAGLACSTVVAEMVYVALLLRRVRAHAQPMNGRVLGASMWRVCLAALGMGAAAWWVHRWIRGVEVVSKVQEIVAVFGAIGAAIGVYVLLAVILRCPELKLLKRRS